MVAPAPAALASPLVGSPTWLHAAQYLLAFEIGLANVALSGWSRRRDGRDLVCR
jgi:hypothetical protein